MMSVSAPLPLTMRPSRSSRTVTSPCASVPVVIAFTENSKSFEPDDTMRSIALNVASTGPSPWVSAEASRSPTPIATRACGTSPVSETTFSATNL